MYENQKLEFYSIEKGEWELLCAVVSERYGDESGIVRLPAEFTRRLVEEIEHMRTSWASPEMMHDLMKQAASVRASMEVKDEA